MLRDAPDVFKDANQGIALAVTLAKVAGGLLPLALMRPWWRVVPRGWVLAGSAGASALLVVYAV